MNAKNAAEEELDSASERWRGNGAGLIPK